MTRSDRHKLIDDAKHSLTHMESRAMKRVSSLIGDDDIVDISFDDIQEVTSIDDYERIEELLDLMYDLEILETLCYEDGIMG